MGGQFYKRTMSSVPLRGKTVLVRSDYNVPLTKDGAVADDYRIRSSVPTIQKLLQDGCKVVIISHLGRPDGKRDLSFTLEPAAQRLAELLGRPVRFIDDCIGEKVRMGVKRAPKVSVTMLENLRFYPGEEANDEAFASQLAKDSGAEYFIQDGFGVVHRAHASTAAITLYLPSVAGLLLEKEYTTITHAMKDPVRPLVAVLGGAKVSDKIPVIEALVGIADHIVIGGAMANTFLAHRGFKMGASKVEANMDETIDKIYAAIVKKVGEDKVDNFLQLPIDVATGASTEPTATRREVTLPGVPENEMALDIGKRSIERMLQLVHRARTIIWNGTLGYAEVPAFAIASSELAKAVAGHREVASIIGGGDTADFAINWDPEHGKNFTHVSTGGGASLELMSGVKLPGIESLLDA